MDDIQLTKDKVEQLIQWVNQRYPDWQGFSDERFIEDELTYKENAVATAQDLLAKEDLQSLLDHQDYQEIKNRFIKVAQSGKNLLYLASPRTGDLAALYSEKPDEHGFYEATMDLLYGTDSSPERVERFSYFLQENQLPNRWTFATYFLYVTNPTSEMFVKPMTKSWFLKFCGAEKSLPPTPNENDYNLILDLCHQLKECLIDYQPTNMIDIQGFIWVAKQVETKPRKLGKNIKELFGNVDDAVLAFKFLETAASNLKFESPDDPLIAFHLFKPGKSYKLHLSYGNWLILGFHGHDGEFNSAHITLLNGLVDLPFLYGDIFSSSEGEPQVSLYGIRNNDFRKNQERLLQAFRETLYHVYNRFSHWKGSPYHKSNDSELATALFDETARDEILKRGIEISDPPPPPLDPKYWKIAPGKDAWNWDTWKEENIIAIGWDGMGDLSGKSVEEVKSLFDEKLKEFPNWGAGGKQQIARFMSIQIGDRIIANMGKNEILGYGTVVGDYNFEPNIQHGHRYPVQWDSLESRPINEGSWAMTILKLGKEKFDELTNTNKGYLFTESTFKLLSELHDDPTASYYSSHKDEFVKYIKEPFKALMRQIINKLDPEIIDFMETEKQLYSRILKNDYGRGGAWDYYWGRLYPKGINKSKGPQLILFLNHEFMFAGFMLGDYADEAKDLFIENIRSNPQNIVKLLGAIFSEQHITIGNRYLVRHSEENNKYKIPSTLEEWINDPNIAEYDLTLFYKKEELLDLRIEDLSDQISKIYNRLFPFVILSTSRNPVPKIQEYLGSSYVKNIQPPYNLEICSEETGFELTDLSKYVKAIQRKYQVIFYGPPGTGKTYLAEKLAKHLIGGGSGFSELIQFHPEVSYEDFIQGIRPQENEDGGLKYPLVPGRFLKFCNKARETDDICVLIIDEINRANLSRVFGELMYLLEYRDKSINLSAGEKFSIPSNVRIIGTMNTADRSIALVDHALRRRFAFLGLYPNYEILRKFHQKTHSGFNPEQLISTLVKLNKQIGDRHYSIGPSYFLRQDIQDHLEDIWRMEIEPYLEEFFFDQPDNFNKFTWKNIDSGL